MKSQMDIDVLYQVIRNLEVIQAPVAIKGGLLLRASLRKYRSDIERNTIDIDANWLSKSPDIFEMQSVLKQAVQLSFPDYDVTIRRHYGEAQSAGFEIRNENGEVITHMDIDVECPIEVKQYMIENEPFTGVVMEEMLSDKISVLSSPQIMRRTKDLLDVYAITKSIPYDRVKLLCRLSERDLGDFSTLRTRKEDLRHGYEKLRGVINKPDFDLVYETVSDYCSVLMTELQNGMDMKHNIQVLTAEQEMEQTRLR